MATLERAFPSAETDAAAPGRAADDDHPHRTRPRAGRRAGPRVPRRPRLGRAPRAARALGDDRRRRARPVGERLRGGLRLDAAEDGAAGRARRPRRLLGLGVRGAAARDARPRAAAVPPLLPPRPEQHHRQLPAQPVAGLPRRHAHLRGSRRGARVARLRRREEGLDPHRLRPGDPPRRGGAARRTSSLPFAATASRFASSPSTPVPRSGCSWRRSSAKARS